MYGNIPNWIDIDQELQSQIKKGKKKKHYSLTKKRNTSIPAFIKYISFIHN